VKLLRFLQFGEVRPVGSTTTKNVEARIVAATNRDLKKLIEQERFRQDLFFRLNTFVIDLPPLRKRKEDIPLYTYHFLKKAVLKLNKRVERINSKVLDMLMQYDWPGNLRELQGVIERAVILCNGPEITPANLPLNLQSEQKLNLKLGFNTLREEINDAFEQETLIKYLIDNDGNVTQAALHAKIPRRTFYRMLEKHHINPKDLIK
jgi:DNA-binding NtrC family response regulator